MENLQRYISYQMNSSNQEQELILNILNTQMTVRKSESEYYSSHSSRLNPNKPSSDQDKRDEEDNRLYTIYRAIRSSTLLGLIHIYALFNGDKQANQVFS